MEVASTVADYSQKAAAIRHLLHAASTTYSTQLGTKLSSSDFFSNASRARINLQARSSELVKRRELSTVEVGGIVVGLVLGIWFLFVLTYLARNSWDSSYSVRDPPPYSPPPTGANEGRGFRPGASQDLEMGDAPEVTTKLKTWEISDPVSTFVAGSARVDTVMGTDGKAPKKRWVRPTRQKSSLPPLRQGTDVEQD